MMNNTVYENLVAFAEFKGIPKDNINIEIYRVMQRFKMDTFKNTPVFKLNRDSRRILSISIALLNNPKIIILDEPTSGTKYDISFFKNCVRFGSDFKKKILGHNQRLETRE